MVMWLTVLCATLISQIALCIDAMDILHAPASLIDTFVIVTNDGDFAPLAQRLRRSGKRVVAVGTGSSLIASCDEHVLLDFQRVPTPRLHTAADVALIEEIMYDLTPSVEDDADGASERAGDQRSAWVDISLLAATVDRYRPGWRRKRLADFINWRHMLESEPYRSSISLKLHSLRGATSPAVYAQLRPHTRETIRATRDEQSKQRSEQPNPTTASAEATTSESGPTWGGWLGSLFFGSAADSAQAETSSSPATSSSSTVGREALTISPSDASFLKTCLLYTSPSPRDS